MAAGEWGVTTHKGNNIYVHVLHWDAPLLALAPIETKISAAHELLSGSRIEFTQNSNGVVLNLPAATKGQVDRVIVLTVAQAH